MKLRSAKPSDAGEIAAIFNHEIEHSAPLWIETLVTAEDRKKWLAIREADGLPVIVAERDGKVAGFGSYGSFRPYEGFRRTVEHLVYVSPDARGRGIGRAILEALIKSARDRGKLVIVGAVDLENKASLDLHRAMGFVETGRMPCIGEKWGQRRTMVLLQRELGEPG